MTESKPRTIKQNSSAHLWFKHISDSLNDNGIDLQKAMEKKMSVWWTPEAVKEILFKTAMRAMFPTKTSTTQLTTKEFAEVSEALQAFIARDYHVNVEIPSQETLNQGERVWR